MSTLDSSIFDMDIENLKTTEISTFENNIYKPSLIKEKTSTYEAVLKFIPWFGEGGYEKSKRTKWGVWLVNPETDEKRMVDCPSTIGQKSVLRDIYKALINSIDPIEKQLAKNFSRKERNFCLVQIIEDKQHKELEGKIKIFEFGKIVREKVDEMIKPKTSRTPKQNPYDIFDGKLFELYIKMEDGFQNYDSCKFLDERSSIIIDGKHVTNKKENYKKILDFLKENAPNLDDCDYKDWDEGTTKFVYDTIKSTLPKGKFLDSIMQRAKKKNVSSPDIEDMNEDEEEPVKKTSTKSTPMSKIPKIVLNNDDDDDEEEDYDDDDDNDNDDELKIIKNALSNIKPSKRVVDDDDDDDDEEEKRPSKRRNRFEEDDDD